MLKIITLVYENEIYVNARRYIIATIIGKKKSLKYVLSFGNLSENKTKLNENKRINL